MSDSEDNPTPRSEPVAPKHDSARFRLGKITAILSAGFFVVSTLLILLVVFGAIAKRPDFDIKKFESLDVTYLQAQWEYRRSIAVAEFLQDIFDAFAWFFMIPPVLCFASATGGVFFGSRQIIMSTCFVLGAVTIGLEFLFNLGVATAADWITGSDWSLGESDWKSFELAYLLVRSMSMWVLAMDWFFLAVGFWLAAHLVYRPPLGNSGFSKRWAHLSVVAGVLSFMAFGLEMLRFENWAAFSVASGFVLLILGIFLIPVWLIWLGMTLGRYTYPEDSLVGDGIPLMAR